MMLTICSWSQTLNIKQYHIPLSAIADSMFSFSVFPPAEVCRPRAHLEPGRHLANPSLQGLHPSVVLYAYEQGAHLLFPEDFIRAEYTVYLLIVWRRLLTKDFYSSVCRRGRCRPMAGQRWMRANWLMWIIHGTCCGPRLWSSPGWRTWELSLRWEIHRDRTLLLFLVHPTVTSESDFENTLIMLQQSVWPGEPVAKVLEDLESAWRWGRVPNLLTAMELVMWTLMLQRPDKVGVHVTIHHNSLNTEFISVMFWCDTDLLVCVCVLAGYNTTAVAHVEAEDAKHWFVNKYWKKLW